MPAEAYRHDDRVLIVHERRNGEVYFHRQRISDTFVCFSQFARMDEARFDRLAAEEEEYDVRNLPALSHQRDDP